jgi:hypothetical protein
LIDLSPPSPAQYLSWSGVVGNSSMTVSAAHRLRARQMREPFDEDAVPCERSIRAAGS